MAAGINNADGRMPMEVDRHLALALDTNGNSANYCIMCTNALVDAADNKRLAENDNDCSYLCMCPRSSLHVFHTACLVHHFSNGSRCPLCNKNCAELVRQMLLNPKVGSPAFNARLLSILFQQKEDDARDLFVFLRLIPAEFVALRQKFCNIGNETATAVSALDGCWHVQLGVVGISQHLIYNNISIYPSHKFYNALQEHIYSDRPAMSRTIEFIETILAKCENKNDTQEKSLNDAIITIINISGHCMSDDDIYDFLMFFVKKKCAQPLYNFVYSGRFIRSISAEKIIKLIECSTENRPFDYTLFWTIWTMVGAGRSFSQEDRQAIIRCVEGIPNRATGNIQTGFINKIIAMMEANIKGNSQVRRLLVSYKEDSDMKAAKREFTFRGGIGFLGSATEEELAVLFDEMIASKCNFDILREVFFLIPEVRRGNAVSMAMMRRIIHEMPFNDALRFVHFTPQQGSLTVENIIELCKLAESAYKCNINNFCSLLVVANFKKIKLCLEENVKDREKLCDHFQKIELYWGIALFGNYFQHLKEYDLLISKNLGSIISLSSRKLPFCCRILPRVFKESPLLRLLSKHLYLFLVKAGANYTWGRHPGFKTLDCSANYALITILHSTFFRNCVSTEEVIVFSNNLVADMSDRCIQNICIFFNIIRDDNLEFLVKRFMYVKLLTYEPVDAMIKSLTEIGFNFFKAADGEWRYRDENIQAQNLFRPECIDPRIDVMIRNVDKYRLLELLREKILS